MKEALDSIIKEIETFNKQRKFIWTKDGELFAATNVLNKVFGITKEAIKKTSTGPDKCEIVDGKIEACDALENELREELEECLENGLAGNYCKWCGEELSV